MWQINDAHLFRSPSYSLPCYIINVIVRQKWETTSENEMMNAKKSPIRVHHILIQIRAIHPRMYMKWPQKSDRELRKISVMYASLTITIQSGWHSPLLCAGNLSRSLAQSVWTSCCPVTNTRMPPAGNCWWILQIWKKTSIKIMG